MVINIDVRDEIYLLLEDLGCKLEERNGIVYVTTPGWELWSFTIPMLEEEQQ